MFSPSISRPLSRETDHFSPRWPNFAAPAPFEDVPTEPVNVSTRARFVWLSTLGWLSAVALRRLGLTQSAAADQGLAPGREAILQTACYRAGGDSSRRSFRAHSRRGTPRVLVGCDGAVGEGTRRPFPSAGVRHRPISNGRAKSVSRWPPILWGTSSTSAQNVDFRAPGDLIEVVALRHLARVAVRIRSTLFAGSPSDVRQSPPPTHRHPWA